MKQKKSAKASARETPREISQEQIAERARAIWQERGRPEGLDLEHWLEAERQLRGGGKASSDQSGTPTDEERDADARLVGLVQRRRD